MEHTDRAQTGDVPYNSSNGRLGASPAAMEEVVFRGNSPEIGGELRLNPGKCVIRVSSGTTGWGPVPGTWQDCPLEFLGPSEKAF